MKTKLTILILLLSSFAIAQKKLTITTTGGTNYMFIPDSLNTFDTKSGKFAYQSGVLFLYESVKHFKIGAGVQYTVLSWKQIYPPDEGLTDFTVNVQYRYVFYEFPLYIQFEPFSEKKISPFIAAGAILTKPLASKGRLLGTDPAGNEQNYFAQMFNYTFYGEYVFFRNMYGFFINAGLNYNVFKSFYVGINGGLKRYYYYDFNDKRSNYTLNADIRVSFKF